MTPFEWKYVWEYFPKILGSLPTTMLIVVVSGVFGMILGTLMAVARIERVPVARQAAAVLVSFIRGTPIFIQLFVIYYGLPLVLLVFGINIMRASKMFFVLVAYAVNVAGFTSEIIRSSVLAVPRSQWDAALSVGHNKLWCYLRVIAPQSAVISIPSFGGFAVSMLGDTALAGAMGIVDVLERAKVLGQHTLHTLEAYFVVAVIFVTLSVLIDKLFAGLEKKTSTRKRD
jgi:L-cystine transport system permease protein